MQRHSDGWATLESLETILSLAEIEIDLRRTSIDIATEGEWQEPLMDSVVNSREDNISFMDFTPWDLVGRVVFRGILGENLMDGCHLSPT